MTQQSDENDNYNSRMGSIKKGIYVLLHTTTIDGFQCFGFARFHAHALKIGDFLESKNLTIKDKNLATRIEQAVKNFTAVKIVPNFQTLKNNS